MNNEQRQARVNGAIEKIRIAYNNTGRVKKFVNVILLAYTAALLCYPFAFFVLITPNFLYLALVNYLLKPKENETRLLVLPKNIARALLSAVLIVRIISFSIIFLSLMLPVLLPVVCLLLVNRVFIQTFIIEVREIFNVLREMPEEDRQRFIQNIAIFQQTTHDPSAVTSINLSVEKLIEKYRGDLSKEEFYVQLNGKSTNEIERYVEQLSELTEDEKSHALKCLKFINDTTGDSFKDNHSQLTLKQATILCWKACQDREAGMEGKSLPLSDEDIKDRKNMFIKGLIDAATTYGNNGQSCAGGTYNKIVESLSGLHPLVVITLDEKEAGDMVKETIIQKFPEMAKENLNNFSEEEKKNIRDHMGRISPETLNYILTTRVVLEDQCKQFSGLNESARQELIGACMSNLSCVELCNSGEISH